MIYSISNTRFAGHVSDSGAGPNTSMLWRDPMKRSTLGLMAALVLSVGPLAGCGAASTGSAAGTTSVPG